MVQLQECLGKTVTVQRLLFLDVWLFSFFAVWTGYIYCKLLPSVSHCCCCSLNSNHMSTNRDNWMTDELNSSLTLKCSVCSVFGLVPNVLSLLSWITSIYCIQDKNLFSFNICELNNSFVTVTGSYWTISLSVTHSVHSLVPGSLSAFLKLGSK